MTATLDRPAVVAPAHELAGTWHLIRLALRRDRVILPIWIVLLSVVPASTVKTFTQFYPTVADRLALQAGANANPSYALLYGPPFDLTTAGGFIAWRMCGFLALLTGLMVVFTVTRHTRAEEDTGRAELLASAVVGRYAALTAALLVAGGASVLTGLIQAVTMIGAGLPAAGSLAFGASEALAGLVFTAVAAVAVQLAEYSRTANGIGTAVVGAAFLLRGAGDSTVDARWLSWLSPIGWVQQVRAFAGERWWVLLLPVVFALVAGGIGYWLLPRRDVGVGFLPPRPGPARAAASLRSPFALAWRLHRGPLLGWTIGTAVVGAVFGSIASGIGGLVGSSPQAQQIMARLGGSHALTQAFLAAMAGMFAMVASLYGVQAVLRMRGEETAIRLEPVLATSVGRLRWAGSHLVFAFFGTAVLLLSGGVFMGLANGLRTGDVGGSLADTLAGMLVQLPATWVVVALAVAIFGVLPGFSAAAWAVGALALLLSLFGPILDLPQAVLDVSPFQHPPKIPGQAFTETPLVWLLAVAIVALVAGLAGWKRRDVG
ncbi:exporter of polyketide antibiotics [Amycolatopsis mediterranei S699]|uniref:Exporter of polyketide antibiotics n=2 Tax=Amycolatopsis mediterranei TaxID=33910 RepID=A0A9R0NQL9_AMYMS|nr:exporter of polyketide antibiotics [Amycolatopsis mediterranei]ADJ42121.1 putative exporter of polyketide antibiotics [Amycolatopsis mediterranei U32]AEK38797.1 exporter of polyketide antibiotics [Amycolatopsis mediterranei S699]AFO73828.1 exporter of polyketide antibiotics [Amycolatopsis mediterranei S699]AGT80957.1 exporter of polyketide antibiotics [Amycolatopsis mediterranei RB]KDO08954.1 ABC transporter permease [Amycolatopsis mediterranei]